MQLCHCRQAVGLLPALPRSCICVFVCVCVCGAVVEFKAQILIQKGSIVMIVLVQA